MAKKNLVFFTILLVVLGLSFLVSPKSDLTKASSVDNVSGWAWIGANWASGGATTNPVGWISFNDANPEISTASSCTGVSYGVNVVGTEINGFAWIGVGENNIYTDCNTTENTVGWLYFDATSGWPTVAGDPYNFAAKLAALEAGKYEIRGWAPIMTKDQNNVSAILTWVRFKGNNYSTVINSDSTVSGAAGEHYAWAGNPSEAGLGWIDMARVRFQPPTPLPLSVVLEVRHSIYTGGSWLDGLTGYAPVNGVDLKATVSGTATGLITYKFDCTNDGIWDSTPPVTDVNPKIVDDVCNYSSVGTYIAKVEVKRRGLTATDTATIWVLPAVTPTPTTTPTPPLMPPLPIWREIAPFLIPFLP